MNEYDAIFFLVNFLMNSSEIYSCLDFANYLTMTSRVVKDFVEIKYFNSCNINVEVTLMIGRIELPVDTLLTSDLEEISILATIYTNERPIHEVPIRLIESVF